MPRLLLATVLITLLATPTAWARHGDDDNRVRTTATCSGGLHAELKLKADDGRIEVEAEIEHLPSTRPWSIVLIADRTVAWRGTIRPTGRTIKLERRLPDLPGADQIGLRAAGPGGLACRATATLPGT
jgi:hypothetical protein